MLSHLFPQVIIVDDGSKDGTTAIGLDYVEKFGSEKVAQSVFFFKLMNDNV